MISQETNGGISPSADLVARMRAVPDTLRRLVGERSAEDLQQPAQDGGVAVVEILSDMQDWEEITGERIARILHEQVPSLETYDDSLWNIEHDYASRDAYAVIDAFALTRAQTVETLANLDDAAWQREALLADERITLQQLVERVAERDDRQIAAIVEALV